MKFARILLSLLRNLQQIFHMVTLISVTRSSFSPSSRCLAPVCPPALWCSCLRWMWVFHGNGTPHEDRSKLVLSPQHQGTKYLIWSQSPGKSYCWTGTGHWGGGRVEKHFLMLRIQPSTQRQTYNNTSTWCPSRLCLWSLESGMLVKCQDSRGSVCQSCTWWRRTGGLVQ